MSTTITGIVTNGVIVTKTALPEGARVEILLQTTRPALTPEEQEEFDGWDRTSAGTIELVETLADEMNADEER